MQASYVALLRGVNVGGKNKLPMKELAELFTAAGCRDVQTYIQSGNVVFRAATGAAAKIPRLIAAGIFDRFGFKSPVVLRSSDEMQAVVAENPFLANLASDDGLHVMFLADVPAADAVTALDPGRSPGDTYLVRGREIYLHLPNGAGVSKLTNAYFDSKLATVSTGRNWRTVTKLLEMMNG
jgi:uncharacterized protein (DUF1697 family)